MLWGFGRKVRKVRPSVTVQSAGRSKNSHSGVFLTFRRNHPVLMGAPTETCAHQEGVISAGRSENSHSGGYLRPVAIRLGRWPSWRFGSPSYRWAKELLTKGGSMGHTVDAVDSYVVRGKPGAPAPPGAALCAKSGRGRWPPASVLVATWVRLSVSTGRRPSSETGL